MKKCIRPVCHSPCSLRRSMSHGFANVSGGKQSISPWHPGGDLVINLGKMLGDWGCCHMSCWEPLGTNYIIYIHLLCIYVLSVYIIHIPCSCCLVMIVMQLCPMIFTILGLSPQAMQKSDTTEAELSRLRGDHHWWTKVVMPIQLGKTSTKMPENFKIQDIWDFILHAKFFVAGFVAGFVYDLGFCADSDVIWKNPLATSHCWSGSGWWIVHDSKDWSVPH